MPWGCGLQFGIGSNDRLTGPTFSNNGRAPYSIWVRHYRNLRSSYAAGGALPIAVGNNGVFTINSTGSVAAVVTNATTSYTIDDAFPLDTWVGWGIQADGSSSANDPTVFFNGKKKTVGSGLTQVGADASYWSSYSTISLGGRSSLGRPSGGLYEDLALWDIQLTDDEFYLLEWGESPLNVQRDHLVIYFPLNDKTQTMCVVSGMVMDQLVASTHGTFYDASHSDPRVQQWQYNRSPARRRYPYFGVSAGGAVTSSFSALSGAIGASGASKSVSIGLSAIAGSIGSASGTKSASAGISAIAGLLGALETAGVGTTDFNAISGALVSVTHSTARLSTIEGKVGSIGSVAGLRGAISSLQAIAGAVATIAGTTSLDRTSSFAAIAGAAAALSKTTARIADLAARAGVLGTNTAATIRAAQIAAVAGLKAAIVGLNGEDVDTLLTVAVSAQAAYECVASARAAYNCTISEAIAA